MTRKKGESPETIHLVQRRTEKNQTLDHEIEVQRQPKQKSGFFVNQLRKKEAMIELDLLYQHSGTYRWVSSYSENVSKTADIIVKVSDTENKEMLPGGCLPNMNLKKTDILELTILRIQVNQINDDKNMGHTLIKT